jgi:hypothetical protein
MRRGGATSSCAIVAALLNAAAMAQDSRESWDRPVVLTGGAYDKPGTDVSLRPFVGSLATEEDLRALFDPPLAATKADERGAYRLALPDWTTLFDRPLAYFKFEGGRLLAARTVNPFARNPPSSAAVGPRRELRDDHRRGRLRRTTRPKIVGPFGKPVVDAPYAVLIEFSARLAAVAHVSTTDAEGRIDLDLEPAFGALLFRAAEGEWLSVRFHQYGWTEDELRASTAALWMRNFSDRLASRRHETTPPSATMAAEALLRRSAVLGSVVGRVTDELGDPVAGVDVSIVGENESLDPVASLAMKTTRPTAPFVQTDDEGRFEIRHAPAGRARLLAAVAGFAPARSEPIVVGRTGVVDGGRIVLRRGARLLVRGAIGDVVVRSFRRSFAVPTVGGKGVLDALGEGEINVSASADCILLGPRKIAIPASGEVVADFSRQE